MGIGMSSTQTTSKSTGTLAGGRKEKSWAMEGEIACWGCFSLLTLLRKGEAGCHGASSLEDAAALQMGWGSAGDRREVTPCIILGSAGHQGPPWARGALLSPSGTRNEEMFVSKFCTGGKKYPPARKPWGEWEQQILSSSGLSWAEHIRSNKTLTAKAPQSTLNLKGELRNFPASSKATSKVRSFVQVKS